jgi:multidrug efflux pump subunit AcrA (membrane-fusion protein)
MQEGIWYRKCHTLFSLFLCAGGLMHICRTEHNSKKKQNKMKRRIISIIISLAVVIGAVLLSAFMIRNKPEPRRDMNKEEVLFVKTQEAVSTEIHPQATYSGRVSSLAYVNLSAEVSGRILVTNVPLKEGQSFKKGDLLVRIYKDDMQAALQSLRSSFLQLVSSALPDLKIDYPDEYAKWTAFFNDIDINGTMPALPTINSEKERVFVASKNILTQYYSIRQQEVNFSRYEIYAPFNGSYRAVNSEVGSVAGMNMQIASLIRTDVMEVIVPVLPEELDWIKEGNIVKLEKNSGQVIQGKVVRIADFIDPTSRSVNVYVSVSNKLGASLLEGEFVEASFTGAKSMAGMLIPREAMISDKEVYVLEEGQLFKKEVQIIDRQEDYYVISGFEEGQILVVESLVDVKPGMSVAPIS